MKCWQPSHMIHSQLHVCHLFKIWIVQYIRITVIKDQSHIEHLEDCLPVQLRQVPIKAPEPGSLL